MKHKVIINADDFGYSNAVNYGIIDAHTEGILTSTTLMANMPGFDHAVSLAKSHPNLGVGVHLVLTCDSPLIKGHKTIAKHNFFHKLKDYKHQAVTIDTDELYAEWRAQIEKVMSAGIQPTHLDSHHHIHTLPQAIKTFIKLAEEYHLPVRANTQKVRKHAQKTTEYFEKHFDDFTAFSPQKTDIQNYLDDLYNKILSVNSIEIMTHPAYIDNKLHTNSSFNIQRILEMEHLTTGTFAKKIKSNKNIELITFKDL